MNPVRRYLSWRRRRAVVKKLITDAVEGANTFALRGNFVNARVSADQHEVTLTTVIRGEPLSWINFNADQLDNFMFVLRKMRSKLRD